MCFVSFWLKMHIHVQVNFVCKPRRWKEQSLSMLQSVDDGLLRSFHLRHVSGSDPSFGTFSHVALWSHLLREVEHLDLQLHHRLLHGFHLQGPIERCYIWPEVDESIKPAKSHEELKRTAWEVRKAVSNKVKKSFIQPHAGDCWSASLQDVALGFASGPYYHHDEVSAILDDKHWIAMPRFPVLQNGKVRPVVLHYTQDSSLIDPYRPLGDRRPT